MSKMRTTYHVDCPRECGGDLEVVVEFDGEEIHAVEVRPGTCACGELSDHEIEEVEEEACESVDLSQMYDDAYEDYMDTKLHIRRDLSDE